MPAIALSLRRHRAASLLLNRFRNDHRDQVEQLHRNYMEAFGEETPERAWSILERWCRDASLASKHIEIVALQFALDGPDAKLPHAELGDEHGDELHYFIPFVGGESRHAFLKRAAKHFDALKTRHGGGTEDTPVSHAVNEKHIDWLYRFHVLGQGYKNIAASERKRHEYVKDSVRALATLLELKLRPAKAGRPLGTTGRKQRPVHDRKRR